MSHPIEDLEGFFQKVKDIFEEILEFNNWFINSEMKGLANSAWDELKSKFPENLSDEAIMTKARQLEEVGLTKQQLAFKIYVLEYFIEKKFIKKILDAIDIILESLSVVFPEIAEALKEFKAFLMLSRKDCKRRFCYE